MAVRGSCGTDTTQIFDVPSCPNPRLSIAMLFLRVLSTHAETLPFPLLFTRRHWSLAKCTSLFYLLYILHTKCLTIRPKSERCLCGQVIRPFCREKLVMGSKPGVTKSHLSGNFLQGLRRERRLKEIKAREERTGEGERKRQEGELPSLEVIGPVIWTT